MKDIKSVDEYIAQAPSEWCGRLEQMRIIIKEMVPEVRESISYGMPYYFYKGRLVYFALWKKHIGVYALFPNEETLKKELSGYTTSKGTIQFPLDKEMPWSLFQKLLKARLSVNELEWETKKKKK